MNEPRNTTERPESPCPGCMGTRWEEVRGYEYCDNCGLERRVLRIRRRLEETK